MQRLRARYLAAMGLPAALAACPEQPAPVSRVSVDVPQADAGAPAASATPTATATATAPEPSATASAPRVPPTGQPPPSVPAGVATWQVTFPSTDPMHKSWGCSETALCFRLADAAAAVGASGKAATCPATIKVPRPCLPGAWCGPGPEPIVDAPLLAAISAKESAKGKACCFEQPSMCIPPNAGRALRDADDDARAAPVVVRDDWRDGSIAGAGDARRWSAIAAAEHASIASFARVVLELVALGAPPELVEDTLRAAIDEVAHARLAFGLASDAREALGPGPLAEAGRALPACSLDGLAARTFRDACVGETIGSARAREEAMRTEDPAVRAALLRVAEDEERHAELAWRTVAWAVRAGGAAAARAVAEALEAARFENADDPVFEGVVVPCARALLA